ncbi:MAG: hypothetical protein E6Q97_17975 [Desulfurellales bacterium]|nr:MAG: hypothetical protein E6Q97_17975 [Desulfurellales bacterium]
MIIKAQRKALTHIKFFELCELVKKHRHEITNNGAAASVQMLSADMGVELSVVSIREACAAVGIELSRSPGRRAKGDKSRLLAAHLVHLYRKLGEPVPAGLDALWKGLPLGDKEPG